uniref:Peptidase A2 domain-containing protein n=1 Tax=Romanomermis culicivorax TaxID=13658 RepID=A0A915I4K5_ROMCU
RIQHLPRPIAGKTRRISKTELEIANKYRYFPSIQFPIQIYGKDLTALIDTGSDVSTMFKDVAMGIFQSSLQLFKVKENRWTVAGGKQLADYGFIFANASTPFGPILLRLAIMEGSQRDIILGRNFLSHPAVKAKLDFGNSKLTIGGKTIPMNNGVSFHENRRGANYSTIVYDNVY